MAIYYPVDANGANTLDAYVGHSGYRDPGVVALVPNDDTINAVQHVVPVESNLLALIASNPSARDYRSDVPYACAAGLNEGDPIRVGGDGIMTLATADTEPNSRVIGFVRSKPSTTTCYIAHFYRTEAYVGLTAGDVICLQDDGTYGVASGTVYKPIGVATRVDEIRLNAFTIETYSGASGTSGYSGYSGTSAYSGFTGTSGSSGAVGSSGASGTSGFSGTYSGYSGESGTSGFSGTYSGYSGASGYSGISPVVSALARQSVIRTTDLARAQAAGLIADPVLKANLAAGKTYKFEFRLLSFCNHTTGTGRAETNYQVTYDNTFSAGGVYCTGLGAHANPVYGYYGYATMDDLSGSTPTAINATQFHCIQPQFSWIVIQGFITTANAGSLGLKWYYQGASYTWTVKAGSLLEIIESGTGMLTGDSGTSGFSGTFSGFSGTSGTSGATAPSGTSGYSGYSGPSGTSGYSGAFSGASGTSGASGPSGESGKSGVSGFSAWSGDSGISGTSGYSGARGISGQSGMSVVGASGVSGMPGSSGQSGESGTSGFSSQSGWSGKSGTSGWSGTSTSGFSGEQGLSGRSGYSGRSGISGPSGVSGVGSSGASGTLGKSGTSGFSGLVGPDGDSGLSGYSGKSGTSGYSGAGVSGTSGTSGFSGNFSGESGRSGYSGAVGASGTSGQQGLCVQVETLEFVVDGGGQPIQSGQSYVPGMRVPYGCTILDCKLYSDTVGDLAIDLWKCANAVYPPDSTDSICSANYPTITNGVYANASLLGWTTAINADDHLAFFVRTNSCITKFLVSIKVIRV